LLLVFQRPLLFGRVNQAKIIDASILLRRGAGFNEVGDGNGGEEANHGHRRKDKKRLTALAAVANSFPAFGAVDADAVRAGIGAVLKNLPKVLEGCRIDILAGHGFFLNCSTVLAKAPLTS
jgi:hypothetical protein